MEASKDLVFCKECKNRKTFLCPMYWMESFPSPAKYDRTVNEGFCDRGERKHETTD